MPTPTVAPNDASSAFIVKLAARPDFTKVEAMPRGAERKAAAWKAISDTATASVYLPTHTAGREIRQDPIRLKNPLDQAEKKLADAGYRHAECEAMLRPARALVSDGSFWRHQKRGLAAFAAPGFFRY